MQRLAILVYAEERHVEVVARISKVVRISPVKGRLLLGSEHQAHVGVGLVPVKPVLAAVVKRHHVRAQAGFVLALVLNGGNFGIARL